MRAFAAALVLLSTTQSAALSLGLRAAAPRVHGIRRRTARACAAETPAAEAHGGGERRQVRGAGSAESRCRHGRGGERRGDRESYPSEAAPHAIRLVKSADNYGAICFNSLNYS